MFSLLKSSIKFFISFVISYIILSINISGKTLFHYIKYELKPVRRLATTEIRDITKKGQETVKKIFNASGVKQDSIERRDSALRKK